MQSVRFAWQHTLAGNLTLSCQLHLQNVLGFDCSVKTEPIRTFVKTLSTSVDGGCGNVASCVACRTGGLEGPKGDTRARSAADYLVCNYQSTLPITGIDVLT